MQFPTDGPVTLRDNLDVGMFVSYLRSSSRTRPVVVLTVAQGQSRSFVSERDLDKTFGREVDVVSLPSTDLTFAFADAVGKEQSAFLGACRVYPPGDEWETHPRTAALRLGRNPAERSAMKGLIHGDVRRALAAAGALREASAKAKAPGPNATQSRPGPPPPDEAIVRVVTTADAEALAQHLLSSSRDRPVAVITRASASDAAFVDVEQIRTDLAGLADVVEIVTSDASWAFSTHVPDKCQVYGGACRVYPVGDGWASDPYSSPLRFAYTHADSADVSRALVSDAMSMVARGGLSVGDQARSPRRVSGVVQGVAAQRGLVKIGDETGVLWPELVQPGVPAERLFRKGMEISGTLDPVSKRITLDAERLSAEEALQHYADGATVLGLVTEVDDRGCSVELFPGYARRVAAEDISGDDRDVVALVAAGDVVPLWLGAVEDGEWLLSLLDAGDPCDAIPAPPILRGGPAWLCPMDAEAAEPAPHPEIEPAGDDLREREHSMLIHRLRDVEQQVDVLKARLARARSELRDEKKKSRRRSGRVLESERLFEDDGEQLNFEIRTAWAHMTSPADKHERPLRPWRYSPHFFETLHDVEGISRAKIVEVLVHVLTGLDAELVSRERHQLRTGLGGDDPVRTRQGGETAWRVSLQVSTPGARRLHYWMCQDGAIELSSVRLHDDFAM